MDPRPSEEMTDRAAQALYLLALNPVAEVRADPNSYGFRPHRGTADALGQCFIVLAKRDSPRVVFDADIKSCFDRISHEWLVANIPMDKAILRKWLAAGFVEGGVSYATEEGTPQGGIISPVLANLTLDGLERVARATVGGRALVNVVRYADDFLITARTPAQLEQRIIPAVTAFLAERGLELSQEKSRITTIDTGFDFLGVTLRKYRSRQGGKLLMMPARKSVKAFLGDVRERIKAHNGVALGQLIGLLNPRIRGWANYYRHVVSSAVFSKVDRVIFDAMVRWMRRRHPNKGFAWLRRRYFRRCGARSWVLSAAPASQAVTESSPLDLFRASSVAIRRHVKVQSAATAFDPEWRDYFRRRRAILRRDVPPKRSPRESPAQPGRVTAAEREA